MRRDDIDTLRDDIDTLRDDIDTLRDVIAARGDVRTAAHIEPPFSYVARLRRHHGVIDTVGRPFGASSTDLSTSRHWNFFPLCRTQ